MKTKQYNKIFSKGSFIIILSFLLFNFVSNKVNAQITVQRDLVFGKVSVSGPGTITISGDNNSHVSTSGGVVALAGITPQSANLHVTYNGLYWYSYATITYDSNIFLKNGSSSISFTPSPRSGQNYNNPGKKQNTNVLDIYLGGTLTIGSGLPGGTYTNNSITVFCTFHNW